MSVSVLLTISTCLIGQGEPLISFDFDSEIVNDGRLISKPGSYGKLNYTTDRFGRPCAALDFDGRENFIEFRDSRALSEVSEFTVLTWLYMKPEEVFKMDGLSWLTLICKGESSNENESPHYRLQVTNKTISLNSFYTEPADINVPLGRWFFLAFTFDGIKMSLYVNSQLVYEGSYTFSSLQSNNESLNIGRDVPGNLEYFSGVMDDFRFFNYSLSEARIVEESAVSSIDAGVSLDLKDENIVFVDETCTAKVRYSLPSLSSCENDSFEQVGSCVRYTAVPPGRYYDVWKKESEEETIELGYSIHVKDTISPSIVGLKDISVEEGQSINSIDLNECTDNCGVHSVKLIRGPESSSDMQIGHNTQVFEVVDVNGNSSEYSREILVQKRGPEIVQSLSISKEEFSSFEHEDNAKDISARRISGEKSKENERVEIDSLVVDVNSAPLVNFEVQKVISVTSPTVTLFLVDAQIEDDDSVNIIINDVVVKSGIRLEKLKGTKRQVKSWRQLSALHPQIISLTKGKNQLILDALNMGGTGKNTIKLLIYEGAVYNRETFRGSELVAKPFTVSSEVGMAGSVELIFTPNE